MRRPRKRARPQGAPQRLASDDMAPQAAWDIVKTYDVKSMGSNAALRQGSSTWGYTHLLQSGRCPAAPGFTDQHIAFTLANWTSRTIAGTSYTYHWHEYIGGTGWNWTVVVEWKNQQGIITAYNDKGIYQCVPTTPDHEHSH